MNFDLASALDLGPRELVAFIGGGGKTTLLLALSRQLEQRGARLIVTTTTKLGLQQTAGRTVCWSADPADIAHALSASRSVMVLSDADDHKVVGFSPESVDDWFARIPADYVLVEADGARRRPLKAPARHEPVVPSTATLVVVVMGIDAIGQAIATAAHRPERAAELTGLSIDDLITADVAAKVLTHPSGGLRGIPSSARVAVALTKVGQASEAGASALKASLTASEAIERVVIVPWVEPDART